MIKANTVIIPESSFIHESTIIECDHFEVGECTYIGPNNKIICKSFIAGDYLYMTEGVEIGRGGCKGPNSNVTIGNGVGIFENTVINPSEPVNIGDNVGIGGDVMIWTHGAWLDVMQGFPAEFGPVKIGKNVWLPARSIVLPNVEIGDNTVIGIGSIVNKNIPSGSLAAGNPCKVIKENYYPKQLFSNEKLNILDGIIEGYRNLAKYKYIMVDLEFDEHIIILTHSKGNTIYDLINRTMTGNINELSEDFRDYLRRRGIKIYTGKPFKSI